MHITFEVRLDARQLLTHKLTITATRVNTRKQVSDVLAFNNRAPISSRLGA